MKEVLIDTSVWIDFLNGTNNRQTDVMSKILYDETEVFISPQIIQEILQGISNDAEHNLMKEKLLSLNVLNIDSIESVQVHFIGRSEKKALQSGKQMMY